MLIGITVAYLLLGLQLLARAISRFGLSWSWRNFYGWPAIVIGWPFWLWHELKFRRHRNRIVQQKPRACTRTENHSGPCNGYPCKAVRLALESGRGSRRSR